MPTCYFMSVCGSYGARERVLVFLVTLCLYAGMPVVFLLLLRWLLRNIFSGCIVHTSSYISLFLFSPMCISDTYLFCLPSVFFLLPFLLKRKVWVVPRSAPDVFLSRDLFLFSFLSLCSDTIFFAASWGRVTGVFSWLLPRLHKNQEK